MREENENMSGYIMKNKEKFSKLESLKIERNTHK